LDGNLRLGLEQGREAFAVPGIAGSMRSKDAHRLIRQGAKLVEYSEDDLEEIRPLIRPAQSFPPPAVSSAAFSKGGQGGFGKPAGPEQTILLRITDKVPKHVDEMAQEVNMPVQRAAAILLELELRGLVSQLPEKYFISGI
jgi:DNA processing protein